MKLAVNKHFDSISFFQDTLNQILNDYKTPTKDLFSKMQSELGIAGLQVEQTNLVYSLPILTEEVVKINKVLKNLQIWLLSNNVEAKTRTPELKQRI
jgi:hypothetical protein